MAGVNTKSKQAQMEIRFNLKSMGLISIYASLVPASCEMEKSGFLASVGLHCGIFRSHPSSNTKPRFSARLYLLSQLTSQGCYEAKVLLRISWRKSQKPEDAVASMLSGFLLLSKHA